MAMVMVLLLVLQSHKNSEETNSLVSDYTDKINEVITNLGMQRTQCLTVPDPSGLSHKVIRYEGIIDLETERVYQ